MAVLLTKTMAQLNEEHKPMYPLFQKPPKESKSETNTVPALQQTIEDFSASENVPKKAAARGTKKPKKTAKDDPKRQPPSNLAAVIPPADHSELLDIDPNDHRRKRQKTASLERDMSEMTGDFQPMSATTQRPQRPGKHSSSKTPVAFAFKCPVKEASEFMSEEKEVCSKKKLFALDFKPPVKEASEFTSEKEVLNSSNIQKQESELEARILVDCLVNERGIRNNLDAEQQEAPNAARAEIEDGRANHETFANPTGESKPKKILHFNPKTGTIGSPPAKKTIAAVEATTNYRSNSRAKQPKSRFVIIRYGNGAISTSAVGLQIDQILKGIKTIAYSPKKRVPLLSKPVANSTVDVPKSTKLINTAHAKPPAALHPFFSSKSDVKPSITQADTPVVDSRRQETTSVGRPRPESRDKPRSPAKPRPSAFTGFPGFGTGAKILKFPGAVEPAWPWKGMVHIRGNEPIQGDEGAFAQDTMDIRTKGKKSKYPAIQILAEEDVLSTFKTGLGIDRVLSTQNINLDDYPPLPSCLRTPIKHLESGYELQKRLRKELHTRLTLPNGTNDGESSDDDDFQKHSPSRARIHPALSKLYASIPTSLTAFDQFSYETQPWIHKYSPKSASEVLQIGRETAILKEWLQNLTVMSVESGFSDRPHSRSSSVSRRPASSKSDPSGKRKRKLKKLEGFVVSSDEEDMDEISEPEDHASPRSSQGLLKSVVKQSIAAKGSKDTPRLTNAVVISGRHGCGKTAAVYAVAKELGFEVFEINSSTRRSGKDILEKVGDMTRNHLVQRSHAQTHTETLDEEAQRISDALADDIKSGRQGTMNSFFKPKDAIKPKPKPRNSKSTPKTIEPKQASLIRKAPTKQQKQSLILFEEVDVLYEEDKQFWATVMALIDQSKRPIIMTCQDESALPMQLLSLHAILRFASPSLDLATDYMLLVAANEGHVLRREAVKSLYQSRHLDLRASLTELNFWCQFAVGDVKGGLDWICPRWPLGSDVDKDGNILRVVSEDTYEAGMGWLSKDFLENHTDYLDIEEETLHEALDGWRLDVGNWQESIDMTGWAAKMQDPPEGKANVRACLSIYDDFADTMSVADLFSGSAFAPDNQVQLDVTMPDLSVKVRDDYLLDRQLLEASLLLNFNKTGIDIGIWMKSRARKYLQVDQHIKHRLEVPSELDQLSETRVIGLIKDQISEPEFILTRQDLSLAFDPISEPEKPYVSSNDKLEASVFDMTKSIITTDVAPYVRSIVSYDAKLQDERTRMSNLLSEGGRKGKRIRTTRSAMSALEGGARSTTRKDRYFGMSLNPQLILKTGMPSWLEAVPADAAGTTSISTKLSIGDSDMSTVVSESGDGYGEDSL